MAERAASGDGRAVADSSASDAAPRDPERRRVRSDHLLVRQSVIEENERRRIGQAIHDSVLHDLAMVRNAVSAGSVGVSAAQTTGLVERIDQVITSLRTLLFELSPPILEDIGLFSAILWLAEHLRARHAVEVTTHLDDAEPTISSVARTILFRSIRELAFNSVKHAPGSRIEISGRSLSGVLRITLSDNGPGFDWHTRTAAADASGHGLEGFGLASVEHQVRGIGGTFDVRHGPSGGTRATIELPLTPSKGAPHA